LLGTVATLVTRSASADPLDDRLAAVAAARARLKTLVGPFTQERTIGLLSTKVQSTGKVWLVRPDRLRWDVDQEQVSYWIAPEGLAYRGKEGHGRLPATQKMSKDLDELRAWLSGDPRTLRDRYDIKELPEGGGLVTLEATPKPGQAAHFARVTLTLDADLVRPKKVVLVEGARDKTEIVFGELAKDASIDPAVMRLPDA
jgi:outer membrane lipoprotein-sorting protein